MSAATLLFINIGQLVTLRGAPAPRRGHQLRQLAIVEDAALLCAAGKIVCIGTRAESRRDAWLMKHRGRGGVSKVVEIDCARGVMLPGFVDSHTHPAFAGPRFVDFERRVSGATYQQIARAGGGIRSSVDSVRKASRAELSEAVRRALQQMAAHGTTTVEAKSGYGLSMEAEIKSLEAVRQAAGQWPGTVVSTLLGAHVVPREYENRRNGYLGIVCKEMIPAAARRKLAQFVDVFVEREAFTLDETRQIAEAARRHGLKLRAHVSQLSRTPIASLLSLGPASLDHLDYVTDADIRALARSSAIGTLLPSSNYFLGLDRYAPARKLIDAGAAIALATDYNPGTSPTSSMPMVLSLACTQMRLTPAEAISAATINGAFSLGLAERKGSIEPGKDADLALFAVRDYREVPYWFGVNLCSGVCLNGEWQDRGTDE